MFSWYSVLLNRFEYTTDYINSSGKKKLATASSKSLVQPTHLHNGFLNISNREMPG